MMQTRFTTLLGATAPIQLAAMPGVGTPELIAAVASAGGVGMLPTPMMSPGSLERALDHLATLTTGVFGANFLIPFLDPQCVPIAARGAKLVEFFYGEPDAGLVERAHDHGALVSWQVGSLAEAVAAERCDCDLVVVQGTEAGGHVRGETSLGPLLSRTLDTVGIPVVAAGGIATSRDVAAVLACGASAARVGTRFVAATESGAHPAYVEALIAASAPDTCLTEAFSVMWPGARHRVLRSAVAAAAAAREEVLGETEIDGNRVPVRRLSVICPTAHTTGRVDAMALYAGESVANVNDIRSAAEIVTELTSTAG